MTRMRILSFIAVLLTVAGLAAAEATVESLGQPCRAKNILSGRVIADRTSGKEWLVLCNTNEASNVELLFIDFRNNTGKAYTAPAGQGSWALQELPGDRLAVGTYYDGKFLVFDLKKMEFIKTVKFPGEDYIWRFALGKDGRLYGGTYPHAKLGALNLDTYEVETWPCAVPPNMYLRYVNATPDGRILCTYTTQRPFTMIFDPATDTFTSATAAMSNLSISPIWNGYILDGNRAFDGKTLELLKEPPFPAPPAEDGDWTILPNVTTPYVVHIKQKNKIYRFRQGDKELSLVGEVDSRLGGFHGVSLAGELLGVFGQDYFILQPGSREAKLMPIPVESGGRPPHFIRADGQGRLWGGPMFGQTLFWVDLKTGEATNTGIVSNRGGEVYDVAFTDDKVYAVAYVGGETIVYDPRQPWNQWGYKNPRTISNISQEYIRPVGGVHLGPDGKLYSGWMAIYGTYGGALAITDPATEKTEVIKEPLGVQAVSGVDVGPAHVFLGTSLAGNGLPSQPNADPKFGVMDLKTRAIVFEHTFEKPDFGELHVVLYDKATNTVLLAPGKRFLVYDVEKTKLESVEMKGIPARTGGAVAPGDGTVIYGSEKELVIFDLKTRTVKRTETMPGKVEHLTRDPDGRLYFSAGPTVYRVTFK